MRGIMMTAPFPEHVKKYLDRVGTRKRKCVVTEDKAGTPITLYSYWDGGSRDEYCAWNRNGQAITLPISGAPGFTQPRAPWTPEAGDVLVEFGTFCGKPATPRVTFYT